MKKQLITAFITSFVTLSANCQIKLDNPSATDTTLSATEGIFLNKGTLKVTSLECYNFSDMLVAFDVKEEYFDYKTIRIIVSIGNPWSIDQIWGKSFTKLEFNRLYKDKKYFYAEIFKTNNMKEKSENFTITRGELEFDIRQHLDKDLQVMLVGWKGNGTYTTVYRTDSYGTTTGVEVENTERIILKEFKVDLKNRKKIPNIPLVSDIKQSTPTETGDCY